MLGWVQYLVYISSFFFPPVGFITFWVFSGRDEELAMVGKWSVLAAFGMAPCRFLRPGMEMWR